MAISKELLKGTTTLLILQLLNEKDQYGYELTKALEQRTDNLFTLKEGTLYPILHALENEGMIEAYWEDTQSARKRKYYRITEAGKKGLKEKKEEWQLYSEGVRKVIGGGVLSEPLCRCFS
ncbi:PadR family transcriptional regulator [Cellulosilyticum sp. ST5]|uniref:Transcriptional regulator, PadR-like family n=1 Tax=Cellulosilyticum lentocellum (strain ATCC 49066 / DSM 5427 / NCIMB 11756 / RHM5) TaxID=642492 RepID=F2JHE1_CELLD|nr:MULTISPECIES: PadR family transcriptional regulator [Cellulosilyticum]ADZ83039.1 transcriptional regulator, PadR-like family [Cellulosilyticum lentocellum DSM 5427]QEH68530.1 helix-turn-helix transcriptional regulator [Cellulosilyticum sp. WCF-2]